MADGLESGNVGDAGRDTRGWIVGDLTTWAIQRGAVLSGPPSLRQTSLLEVKWFDHPPGDERPAVAPPDAFISISILIDGDLITDFTSVSGEQTQNKLSRRGDYVIWHGPSYSHRWRTERGATIVTVRWPAMDAAGLVDER